MSKIVLTDILIDIDDYTIKKKIGEGGFGTVFLAVENKTKKEVALKIMIESGTLKKKKEPQMTMAIGTPIAMAPELFMDGEECYTVSVDVYAYAFLLYKMFTTSLAFEGPKQPRSPQQYMVIISKGQRPKKPEL